MSRDDLPCRVIWLAASEPQQIRLLLSVTARGNRLGEGTYVEMEQLCAEV